MIEYQRKYKLRGGERETVKSYRRKMIIKRNPSDKKKKKEQVNIEGVRAMLGKDNAKEEAKSKKKERKRKHLVT